MKFRFSVLLLLFLFCSNLKAQTDTSPLDTLFEGGKQAYEDLAAKTLVFPRRLMGEGIYGTLVVEITVSPNGVVKSNLMTKGHQNFELVVLNLIDKSSSHWIKKNSQYKLYQPVFFGYPIDESPPISEQIENFPSSFEFPILDPIVRALTVNYVTKSSPGPPSSSTRLTLGDLGLDKIDDSDGNPKKEAKSTVLKSEIKSYLKNESSYVKQLKKRNSDKAFQHLCDMIRFNPFDSKLIQKRMELAQELGINDYLEYDTLWLQALQDILGNK